MEFTKYLKIDRKPPAISEFGWDVVKNQLVLPYDDKCFDDYEGIERYDVKKLVEKVNSIRLSGNNKHIINWKYSGSKKWVIYKLNKDLSIDILDVIRYNPVKKMVESLIPAEEEKMERNYVWVDSMPHSIPTYTKYQETKFYYPHLLEIIAEAGTHNVKLQHWLNYETGVVYYHIDPYNCSISFQELLADFPSYLNPIYVVKEMARTVTDIEEIIPSDQEVIYKSKKWVIVLKTNGIIQAILQPGYVKEIIKEMDIQINKSIDLEISDVEYEVKFEEGIDIKTLAKNAIRGAKNKFKKTILQMIDETLLEKTIEKFVEENPEMIVTYKDSTDAGNCDIGTQRFKEKYGIGDSITLQELYDIYKKDRNNKYDIQRVIKYLMLTHKKEVVK